MPLQNIGIVYRKELSEALRDRRTLISTLLVPLLLFPLMSVGFGALAATLVKKAEEETPKVMLLGGADSPAILEALRAGKKFEIVPATPDWKDRIIEKEIRAAIAIPDGFEASLEQQNPQTIAIYKYEGELKSSISADTVERSLKAYRDTIVEARLDADHVPSSVLTPFRIKQDNVAPPEKVGGAAFGGIIGYMVILLCLTGGMYPAMDLTAGEKERGTMETILSSPVSRVELVLGKFFLVLTASLVTAALSVVSMGVSFWGMQQLKVFDVSKNPDAAAMQLQIRLPAVLSVFLMALPLAVLFSAGLITISLFAKSYKEAQSYITPLMIVVVIPAVAAMLPGVELTAKLALIPILNVSLLCKELVTGTYHWNFIALIFLSTCVYAAAALFLAVKMFQREDVLFRS
ncbi:MAG TPA: ABC transporter permease [Candidatus Sulfotelmatobacter sp.]|jgi:sodium transport system permease protein|nr:ABC transporter permease [Candidatus Sulfotelmatobacter sp.]